MFDLASQRISNTMLAGFFRQDDSRQTYTKKVDRPCVKPAIVALVTITGQ